jgi:outer membrane lipoprotein-sorting protein
VPTKWERLNASSSVELRTEFSDYTETTAGLFPSRIVFEANLQRKKVQIRYQQPEMNATISPELFSQQKPPNVQEVPIEAIGS